jgi:hypothetical protein
MKFINIFFLVLISFQLEAQCYPDRHSTNWFDGWVSCQSKASPNPANKAGHWMLFDLGTRYRIDRIKFWNSNDPSHLDWGIRELKIDYSKDSTSWRSISLINLDKAPGHNRYEGMDWLDVNISDARYILLTAESNFGKDSCYGLAEVQFSAEKVNTVDVADENPEENAFQVNIKPNPFKSQFVAEISGLKDEQIQYQVVDLLGKVWQSGQIQMQRSTYQLRIISEEWPAGNYVLALRKNNHSSKYSLIKMD